MNFIILLFSYSHKCSTLVSIRNKKPKNGLSKCQWSKKFTTTPFPLNDCTDIGRQDFPNELRNAFQQVTFGFDNDEGIGNAQNFDSAICHVLSYVDIRTYVCNHLDSYFNLLTTAPNLGWLQYSTIHLLSISEIHLNETLKHTISYFQKFT